MTISIKAELYNKNFNKVPLILQRLVGSEQIAAKIKLENGEMLYVTLLIRRGTVGDFYRYETPADNYSKLEPSITVETDEQTVRNEQTVRKILDSQDPFK